MAEWRIDRAFSDLLGGSNENDRQFNAEQAEIQRQWEAQQAQKQMDFQEKMSNTAYQRQVADMQAAGLNPALMYGNGGGGGASTPSGSMPHSAAATSNSKSSALPELVSAAVMLATGLKGSPLQANAANNAKRIINQTFYKITNNKYYGIQI